MQWAEPDAEQAGPPRRRFADLRWTTKDSWSRRRRVVANAGWMPGRGDNGANPRFVVTSLKAAAWKAQPLDERLSCARGEPPRPADRGPVANGRDRLLRPREKRIEACQLELLADPRGSPWQPAAMGWLHQREDEARQAKASWPSMASACPDAAKRRLAHARLAP